MSIFKKKKIDIDKLKNQARDLKRSVEKMDVKIEEANADYEERKQRYKDSTNELEKSRLVKYIANDKKKIKMLQTNAINLMEAQFVILDVVTKIEGAADMSAAEKTIAGLFKGEYDLDKIMRQIHNDYSDYVNGVMTAKEKINTYDSLYDNSELEDLNAEEEASVRAELDREIMLEEETKKYNEAISQDKTNKNNL